MSQAIKMVKLKLMKTFDMVHSWLITDSNVDELPPRTANTKLIYSQITS